MIRTPDHPVITPPFDPYRSDRPRSPRARLHLTGPNESTYNSVEAVIALSAGVVAGSVALVGFGLDSVAGQDRGESVTTAELRAVK